MQLISWYLTSMNRVLDPRAVTSKNTNVWKVKTIKLLDRQPLRKESTIFVFCPYYNRVDVDFHKDHSHTNPWYSMPPTHVKLCSSMYVAEEKEENK